MKERRERVGERKHQKAKNENKKIEKKYILKGVYGVFERDKIAKQPTEGVERGEG